MRMCVQNVVCGFFWVGKGKGKLELCAILFISLIEIEVLPISSNDSRFQCFFSNNSNISLLHFLSLFTTQPQDICLGSFAKFQDLYNPNELLLIVRRANEKIGLKSELIYKTNNREKKYRIFLKIFPSFFLQLLSIFISILKVSRSFFYFRLLFQLRVHKMNIIKERKKELKFSMKQN